MDERKEYSVIGKVENELHKKLKPCCGSITDD